MQEWWDAGIQSCGDVEMHRSRNPEMRDCSSILLYRKPVQLVFLAVSSLLAKPLPLQCADL